MRFICKLDRDLYRCVTEDIAAEEVIITEERIEHIRLHHPETFEKISPFFRTALENPDYILKDAPNTGLILKSVEVENLRIQMVLRIHTSRDPAEFKNSILSAWEISESRWRNYVNNKMILYKRE